MNTFEFVGRLAASKSILNRALIARSFAPDLKILGHSGADDVRLMREGLLRLARGEDIEVGAAGTTLRFLALRAARVPGRHRLTGHERLFTRPQEELVTTLAQLGVEARLGRHAIEIEGDGWSPRGDTLLVPSDRSSQFVTAVLMNAWNLPFDLYVSPGRALVSEGYWRMSVRLAHALGMNLQFWDQDFRVPRESRVSVGALAVEIDVSSAFAIAGVAAVAGRARLHEFPDKSLQPDAVFVDILNSMGVPITLENGVLRVDRAERLRGVAVNLRNAPDLFPVLAILCALAEGPSDLYGAPHLVHKESDRLHRIADLIRALGREIEVKADGLRVRDGSRPVTTGREIPFDCDQDHRLAFAAATLRGAGHNIKIANAAVVSKSFPDFWSILGWHP